MIDRLYDLDAWLYQAINVGGRRPALDPIVRAFYAPGPIAGIVAASLVVLAVRFRWRLALPLALALAAAGLSDGTCGMLKDVVRRERPFVVLPTTHDPGGSGTYSFPSSHAANSTAFAVVLLLCLGRPAAGLACVAAAVSFSRIYFGNHYPSDVLCGASLGVGCAFVVRHGYRHVRLAWDDSPAYATFLFWAGASIPLRLFYIHYGPLDLSPDEAHYWEWSRRLDASYYSKGPVIAWLIAATARLGRESVLAVRFLSPFFNAGAALLLAQLANVTFECRKAAALAGALVLGVPLFAVYGVAMTTDSPLVFVWCFALYAAWRAVSGGSAAWWHAAGLAVGAGFLVKYVMVLFVPCLLAFLLTSTDDRRLLKSVHPWLAAVWCAAAASPVLFWNARHDWVTFRHTAGHANLAGGMRVSVASPLEFAGSQIGLLTPFLALLMGVLFVRMWRRDEPLTRARRFLLCCSAPVLALFLLKSVQGKVQGNWAMVAYPAAFVLAASELVGQWHALGRRLRIFAYVTLSWGLTATLALHSPLVHWLPERLDPTARLSGWRELGREADRILGRMPDDSPCFVLADSYQVASEAAFTMSTKPTVYCVNVGRRMNQYDLWPGLDERIGENGLYVAVGDVPVPERIASAFDRHRRLVVRVTTRQGRSRTFTLAKCFGFRGASFPPPQTY